MRDTIKLIIAPLLSLAFLMLSNGFFLTFVSAKLNVDGFSPFAIGAVQGSYYAGFLIAALKCERTIQRIKHIRAFSFFTSIATATTLLTVFAHHIAIWMFLRFIMGVCIAALYVVIESWLLIISNSKNRGVILAVYMVSLYIAQSASQFIINYIDIHSMMAFIIAGILASLSILPVTHTHTRIPEMTSPHASAIFKYLAVSPLGASGALLAGIILGSFYTFGPTFAQENNISIALLMSITIAGGFLLQYPIGHLSDIFDRRRVVMFVSLMSLGCAIAVILTFGNPFWVLVFSFFLGGFTFTIYPLSITQVVDGSPSDEITTVTGVMLFVYSIGAVIGPFLTPVFINALNNQMGLYYCIAVGSLLLTIVGFVMIGIRKPIPKQEQESFVALPPQTPVGFDMDPRTETEEEKKEVDEKKD